MNELYGIITFCKLKTLRGLNESNIHTKYIDERETIKNYIKCMRVSAGMKGNGTEDEGWTVLNERNAQRVVVLRLNRVVCHQFRPVHPKSNKRSGEREKAGDKHSTGLCCLRCV